MIRCRKKSLLSGEKRDFGRLFASKTPMGVAGEPRLRAYQVPFANGKPASRMSGRIRRPGPFIGG
jgi:hypothetical protein